MKHTGFFNRILLPSLIAILLFLAAIYIYVIPGYRESLMDKKRETIRELTNTAWSVMHRMDETTSDSLEVLLAKEEAREIIRGMRYGNQNKDYFWITDTTPTMIMHPYRPAMDGMILSDFEDQEGKRFFVEIANLAKETGNGYIDYKWQWKDDSLMVVPKLSYVKLYKPWGWIVGTGIYVEDVQREITTITRQVVWISVFITIIITAIIGYLARRNFLAEQQRKKAMEKQRDTMEKYKKLLEVSTDGVLMTLNSEVIYCNPYLLNLLGYSQQEAEEHDEQFVNSLHCLLNLKSTAQGEGGEIVKEHKIRKKNKLMVDVIITRSEFEMAEKNGYIYTIKDVSRHRDVEREMDLNMGKFKSIADTMHVGVFRCTIGRSSRFVEINKKIPEMLGYASEAEIRNLPVQELFLDRPEKKEVIRAISEGTFLKEKLLRIQRADGSILPTIVSLFPVKDVHDKVVYCDGILMDAYEHLSRNAGFRQNPVEQQLSANVLLQPVKDFMKISPLCEMSTSLEVAARLMTMRNSDIVLVKGDKQLAVGLVTHSDISRRAVAKNLDITATPVSQIMSAPIICVSDQDLVMDAFTLMMQHKVSYVVIKSTGQSCPGYISLLALSELKTDTPEFLINSIQKSRSVQEIAVLMQQLPRLVARLTETGAGAATSGKVISRISDTITEKIIHQAITEAGDPPAPFVFLALGSEGRREQSLATDQDNAIVYLPQERDHQSVKKYFLQLGKKICTLLDVAGYPFCVGNVMAMNPQWCQSLEDIKKQVSEWIETPNPTELLHAGIFFDFRPVYGEFEIANKLQRHCLHEFKEKHKFFYNLAQNTIALKPPLNVMGQITFDSDETHNDHLDVKKPLMALTGIMRLWALKYGISERNTMERLQALKSAKVLPESTAEEFSQALRYLMLLRIRNQLHNLDAGAPAGNSILAQNLSELDRTMLKKIFSAIAAHQSRMATEFRIV